MKIGNNQPFYYLSYLTYDEGVVRFIYDNENDYKKQIKFLNSEDRDGVILQNYVIYLDVIKTNNGVALVHSDKWV